MNVLTPWFPARVEPVHKGAYLTRDNDADSTPFLLQWDGKDWRDGYWNKWWAPREWRGLAFDPGALPDTRTQREVQSWAHGWWAALEAKRSGA